MERPLPRTKLRVGIIGAGRIGKVHAETLAFRVPEAEPVAIADPDGHAAASVAERYGIPKIVRDTQEIFDDQDIDAVLICSPTSTHADFVTRAARARKHVFCEKPIDHSLTKIDLALREVSKSGVKFQVGFNRRFDANFARVRSAVLRDEIGTPHLMHIISRDPGPPPMSYIRSSGGIFLDMTIHDFDMARFLVADEVESVYSAGAVRIDPEIGNDGDLDTVLIVMQFKSGIIGTIDNSRRAVYGYDQRVEILGSKGRDCDGKLLSQPSYPQHQFSHSARPATQFLYGSVRRELRKRVAILRACGAARSGDSGKRDRWSHRGGDGDGRPEVLR
jgi:myo-inositol 2-dehydrogenase/D-chiro-inositol 1-dehydrogenase